MSDSRGFTLIEVVIAAAIVAILAAVAFPTAQMAVKRSKEKELRTALWKIRGALDAYKQAVDEGRIFIRLGESGYPPSLQVLVDGVEDAKSPESLKPKIYFLRRIPRDPFNSAVHNSTQQSWGVRSYASSADNPQAGKDVFDVYSLSSGTGLNGVPYREW